MLKLSSFSMLARVEILSCLVFAGYIYASEWEASRNDDVIAIRNAFAS